MQLVPRYLVKNQTEVISNGTGFVVEYKPVYSRQLKIYKGIDNVLDFRVLNADQKPVSIINKIPVIMIFDENQRLVIQRDCTVLETTTPSKVGMLNVTITENDLLNLKQQYLSYSIHIQDGDAKELTYSSSYFDNKGTIYLDGHSLPAPLESATLSTFTEETENNWCSESVDAQPAINGNSALHTVAMYFNDYSGDITVQGTLDNQIVGTTQWADIETASYQNNSTVEYINFNGVFSHVRVCSNSNPADKITKILVRN